MAMSSQECPRYLVGMENIRQTGHHSCYTCKETQAGFSIRGQSLPGHMLGTTTLMSV